MRWMLLLILLVTGCVNDANTIPQKSAVVEGRIVDGYQNTIVLEVFRVLESNGLSFDGGDLINIRLKYHFANEIACGVCRLLVEDTGDPDFYSVDYDESAYL